MAKSGVRRPDFELELTDSLGYIGRVCVANDRRDDPAAWSMLWGILEAYIDRRFDKDLSDVEDRESEDD